MLGKEVRQHVFFVQQYSPHPGQVVEADLVDDDALRLDAEPAGEAALEAECDVADPDRAMSASEQLPRDDSDVVGVNYQPCARRRVLPPQVCDLWVEYVCSRHLE